MSELGKRIKQAASGVGGLNALSVKTGVKRRTLGAYVSGDTEPQFSALAKIADATGYSLDWFGGQINHEKTMTKADFAFVPRLDVTASAGSGSIAISEETEDLLAFRADWLRDRGINPKMASALMVAGDSMEPVIRDGDILLVDRSIDRVRDNGIYVVILNDLLMVKRVHTTHDGAVTLISENKIYPPEAIPPSEVGDLIFAGRVMWFGRSI